MEEVTAAVVEIARELEAEPEDVTDAATLMDEKFLLTDEQR